MQEVIIEIDRTGHKTTIDAKGFVGTECTALTQALDLALGDVERRDMKPESRQVRQATHTIGGRR